MVTRTDAAAQTNHLAFWDAQLPAGRQTSRNSPYSSPRNVPLKPLPAGVTSNPDELSDSELQSLPAPDNVSSQWWRLLSATERRQLLHDLIRKMQPHADGAANIGKPPMLLQAPNAAPVADSKSPGSLLIQNAISRVLHPDQNVSQVRPGAVSIVKPGPYDLDRQPELAMRHALVTQWFGDADAGGTTKGLDEQYGDKVAELASHGNPYQRAVLTSVFGGPDADGKVAPAWERMGMSRSEFKQKLIEAPWEITNKHSGLGGRSITQQDYKKLQDMHGPLGYLLGMGVEPKMALGIQETWGRSFYGGVDRQGLASKPIWERWHLPTPHAMQQIFVRDLFAQSQFARLTGGVDPLQAGKQLSAPFGDMEPQRYAQRQLSKAEETLGVGAAEVHAHVSGTEQRDFYALSFTAISSTEMLGLAQSPHVRNDATRIGDPKTTGAIGNFSLAPGERYPGLFGYTRVTGPENPQTPPGRWLRDLLGAGQGVQLHGMLYPISENGDFGGVGGFAKLQFLPPKQEDPQNPGKQISAPSGFVKVMGDVTTDRVKFIVFFGAADEDPNTDSRGRSPGYVLFERTTNPDGSTDRLQGGLGWPLLAGRLSPEKLKQLHMAPDRGGHSAGLIVEARKIDGEWHLISGVGAGFEFGIRRWQFYPFLSWNPLTYEIDSWRLMAGHGHFLIGASVTDDPYNPVTTYLSSNPDSVWRGQSYVSFSNPHKYEWSFSAFGGSLNLKGVSGGISLAQQLMSDTEVFVNIPDNPMSKTAEDVAKDVHRQLAESTMTYETLPEGVAVAASTDRDWLLQGMLLVKYYVLPSVALGWGSGERFEVLRAAADTWVVSRFTDSRSNGSLSIGSFGVGAAGLWYDADRTGESFRFDGHKVQMTEAQREAMLLYQRDGIPPGALQLEQSEHPPADLVAYRNARDSVQHYNKLLHDFGNIKTGKSVLDEYRAIDEFIDKTREPRLDAIRRMFFEGGRRYTTDSRDLVLSNLRSWRDNAVGELAQIYRETIKPGMQAMDGVTLERRVVSDTESRRISVLLPVSRHDIGHTNSIDPQGTTSGYSHVQEKGYTPFYPDVYHTSFDWRVNVSSAEQNSARLAVSGPLPLDQIGAADIAIDGPPYMRPAVMQGKMRQSGTTLTFDISDANITALGKDQLQGKPGKRLWNSYRERALALLENRIGTIADMPADIRDYTNAEATLSDPAVTKLTYLTGKITRDTPDLDRETLTDFVRGMTPETFAAAGQRTQQAVFELVLATSSGAHSRFEALGLVSQIDDSARRLKMFSQIVESAADPILRTTPNRKFDESRFNAEPAGSAGGVKLRPKEGHFTYEEPTLEFMRFLKSQVQDQELKASILAQSGATLHLPQVVTRHLRDSPQDLSLSLRSVTQTRQNSQDAAGALIAAAQRDGTQGAWRFLHENSIDPRYLLTRLGRTAEDQILRNMVVDILEPGTKQFAPHTSGLFVAERQAAEALSANPDAAYPISAMHALQQARGTYATSIHTNDIVTAEMNTRYSRNVALKDYATAVGRMIRLKQTDQLNREDALAYAAYLYGMHSLAQMDSINAMQQKIADAEGPAALPFLQQHNVSLMDFAQAEARKQTAAASAFPRDVYVYESDFYAQTAAAVLMEQEKPLLPGHVPAINAAAYRALIVVPREEFLALRRANSAKLGEALRDYALSVQTYIREHGAADLSDMDLRAIMAGGSLNFGEGLRPYGAHAAAVRDRFARNGYTEQDFTRVLRDSVREPASAAQFVASGNAFQTTRTAPGSLALQSVADIEVGNGKRAYRTTFSVGKDGATLVQLLPRDSGAAETDARTLNEKGELFLLGKDGGIKLWTRREPGTGDFYVVHHEGKDLLSATPSGVLNVRLTPWLTVRDALRSGNLGTLAVTPASARKGDLYYSELQSSWTTYDPQSGKPVNNFEDFPKVEPMLFAVRSPNEMYVQR